jgi:hypothetical protein
MHCLSIKTLQQTKPALLFAPESDGCQPAGGHSKSDRE